MPANAARKLRQLDSPTTEGKLTLYISDPPSPADEIAIQALKAFDHAVVIRKVRRPSAIFTPLLDAIEYDLSRYHGLDSILGFVSQEVRSRRSAG